MKVNKFIFMVALLFCTINLMAQRSDISDISEVERLIDSIGWNSFEVLANYGSTLEIIDVNASKLEMLGKSEVSNSLIEVLRQDNKTVIAHLILTKLWEEEVFFLTKNHHKAQDGFPAITMYMVNNLRWSVTNNKPTIDDFEQSRIYKYWKKRVVICE